MTEAVVSTHKRTIHHRPQISVDARPATFIRTLSLPSTPEDVEAVFSFAARGEAAVHPILTAPELISVVQLGYLLQDVRRKVSGEPYFKHVLRTVMHVSRDEVFSGLPDSDARVLPAAAYLHDAIELQRKASESYDAASLLEDVLSC